MAVSADDFKQALQKWASGITIVTTKSSRFGILGMTATSFSSVSMDPPQILVCINDSAVTIEGIKESRHFAVNILNTNQQLISNQFASGDNPQQRFESVTWREGASGTPILDDTLASLECTVEQLIQSGTHWVVIGKVQNVTCRPGDPLMYFKGAYRALLNND
jgi:flavin reductase (DIM6/NTAB) family NADH-FMN oxidoreductase RutF